MYLYLSMYIYIYIVCSIFLNTTVSSLDFDCILTNLNLNKIDKNKFQLTKIELLRTENILKRAIDVEAGVSEAPRVTEEHPDGCKYLN